jgi:hypothetical protein
MINGKILARCMTAAVTIAMAGCKIVSDPPKSTVVQDVEFLRGCWVSKTAPGGEITGFLRLLPGGADGLTYQGYVQVIANGQQSTPVHLSFVRDGSSMTIRSTSGRPVSPDDRGGLARPHAPLPDAIAAKASKVPHRVSYAADPGQPQASWIAAEGDGETLAVYAIGNGGAKIDELFRGERDGCD